ncbi:unnamed protein product [Rhizoctonia solani]|uniref:Uncharacterized protein n=1 Tax=Rhizoctonia solani TaxID=456999 RepID=A0A8H3DGU2_9AGAM|nr:unnamed protein product [Rhizoctonia solani]
MPISDFLHRATNTKARSSSTPRSQSQSATQSSNNSDRDDEHHYTESYTRSGRTSPMAGPSSASPSSNGFSDEKRALSPETRASTITVAGEPPAYHRSIIPREDVTYTFIRVSPSAMVLKSEVTGEGIYHVSHAVDLWNPFVWITTIRRGSQEDGEVVAEFEMGLAKRRARLALRGQDDMLVNVVKKAALWGSLNFQFRKKRPLTWTMQKNSTIECHLLSPHTSLAVFAPTIFATNSDSAGSLTVTPGGHNREVFDHIITSLLLVERLRQLPDKDAMKKLSKMNPPRMSFPRPPYADDSSSSPYNHRPEIRTSMFVSPVATTSAAEIAFPEPIISGNVIPSFAYEGSLSAPPHGYQDFLSAAQANRPPKRPVPLIPAQTAPPSGWPHLGPASHMRYNRDALSEGEIPRSRPMKINLPDPKTLELLTPEEVTSGAGLQRFQDNQLHKDDRYWHRIVPEAAREKLGKKEQARQQEIFEVISSEQLYVSDLEVWLKAYRDPLRTEGIIASHTLEPLIQDIFANIEEIKIHHEVLLRALFETQKKNFHEVYSIMDDLLDAVSNEEFQNSYVRYISNMDTALARHGREKETNPTYIEFVSSAAATARHPYVQRMGFTSFIQRAGRRLGQLKLLVEQLSKSTDVFHPDQQGSIEMVLDMLHRTVMKGQADGQASAEEIALRAFRESLENHPWDFADLGLAHAHRAVKFEGRLTQLYPSPNFTIYAVLLDNYLVFTQLTGPNHKRRLIHKPIPLELLDAELETTPPKTRTRVASMLSRADSTELVRIAIKRDGEVVLQVGAQSKGLAEKWIQHIQEAVLLRKLDVDDNKLLDFSPVSSMAHLLRDQVKLQAACPFVFRGNHFLAGATTTGVFFGQKNDSTARSVEALPAADVSQLLHIPSIGLIILHGGSLSVLPVDCLVGPNRRSCFLEDEGIPLSNSSDGYVSAVSGGIVGSDRMVAFISKSLVRKKLHVLIYDAPLSTLRRVNDPIVISESITGISFVSGMLFLSGRACQVIADPVNAPDSISTWPIFGPSFTDSFNLKYSCSTSRFISALETEPSKILLVYESHGCFVDTSGQPIPSHRMLEWSATPKAASFCKSYIVLFSDQKIEIRRSADGHPLQIIGSRSLNLIHPILTYSSSEAALVTTNGEEGTQRQLLGELLPTSKIEWDPTTS